MPVRRGRCCGCCAASFGDDGYPKALAVTSACDAITQRWIERGLPALAGPIDLPYQIAHQRIAHVATHSGVPVGYWRSVGRSHNAFFSEGFIDELAHEAKQDPVAFRQAMLKSMSRHAAVLKLAADRSGPWPMRCSC